jgi:CubicO group peptidase (beta-lactamase class C family)
MRLAFAPYFTFAAVLLSGLAPPVFGVLPMTGTYVPELQAVDTLLQNFMVGKPIPGGTIAITHNDKVIYERGIGYSDATSTVPMQENALMRLASVSKPVTASAIHQLVKDGQLNLNAKVFNIAGNEGILNITPHNGTLGDNRLRDITVQQLLEHKGGWNRDTAGDLAFRDVQIATAMGVSNPPGIANSAQYILSRPLQFTPGTAYNYSNIGYMFLGMVVEAASGQGYESYVDSKVLAPSGIPTWEVNAGRTFAADQNPREPFYSSPNTAQNVYNPGGPHVSSPYGEWDHEKALAYGGLIGSSKAIALLAQSRIAAGPEIGKLRSDYTTHSSYWWYHTGSLPGTDTLMLEASWKDWTYAILFDRRPTDGSSYSDSLVGSMQNMLEGLNTWPAALDYAGDFTNDQWLTLDDITLFKQALLLGSETEFTQAYPTARYLAGDFDDNGLVSASDMAGFIASLQHAGVPLSGANFTDQNLTNVHFFDVDLTGADLTRADARGATALDLSDVTTTNLIRPHGHISGLNLAAGEKLVAYAGVPIPVHVSGGFSIAAGATFDLTDNDAIVQSSAANKTADFDRMYEQIKSGYAAGGWTGTGITSSEAAANPDIDTGLVMVDNAIFSYTGFSGQTVNENSILLKYTYYGDIDVNGQVDADDLTIFANNFGKLTGAAQVDGDIDFDNDVDADDLTVFANNFGKGVGAPLASGAVEAVPEPATWILLIVATLAASGVARRLH